WALSTYWSRKGYVAWQTVNPQWVIQHCLSQCGVSATPYRPPYLRELQLGVPSVDYSHFWLSAPGRRQPTHGVHTRLHENRPSQLGTTYMYEQIGGKHPEAPADAPRPLAPTTKTHLSGGANMTSYWVTDRRRIRLANVHFLSFTIHKHNNVHNQS